MLAFLKQELDTQIERYSRAPISRCVAFGIYSSLIAFVPIALQKIVPLLSVYLTSQMIYLVLVVTTLVVMTVVYNTAMYFVYTLKMPFFEQYRVNKDKLWPWEENPQKWREILGRNIKYIATDILIVTPILVFVSTKVDFYIVMDVFSVPSLSQLLPQLAIMHIFEDLIFFSSHWLLHQPFLYRFHKVHHEYTITVSIAGLHSHIIQFLLSNSISVAIYMKIASLYAPIHISTAIVWLILRMWDAYNGHSGYVFPWSPLQLLPFCANDDFHDFHHSHNCGNYGSQFRYLDAIFGTIKPFKAYKKALKAKAHSQ